MLLFVFQDKRERITFLKYVLFHVFGITLGKHNLGRHIIVQSADFADITQLTNDGVCTQIQAWIQFYMLSTGNMSFASTFYYIKVKGKVSIPQGLNQMFSWSMFSVDCSLWK